MRRLALFAVLLAGVAAPARPDAPPPSAKDAAAQKAALQKVGDLIGDWKGDGKAKVDGKDLIWKDTVSLGWKFKGAESWIELAFKEKKFIQSAELRYDVKTKAYKLTTKEADKGGKATKEVAYDGAIAKGNLVLTAKDKDTGDVKRLTLYTAAEGARLIVKSETQSKGKGLFSDQFSVAATKEGESFAGGTKKPECCVTGGLGTMAVSYNGKTYYVCCSGCREEFDANPKKYADASDKKK